MRAWLLLVVLLLAPACGRWTVLVDVSGGTVRITGTVHHESSEGGFWVVRGDDGTTYDPMDLPPGFQAENLRVSMVATVRNDLVSVHMVGPIVEIVDIERL